MIADPWQDAKQIIGGTRVTLGPQASQQWLEAPEHLAMVLARYRAAAALIGDAGTVLEIGCGEGIGAGILAKGRDGYLGIDTDREAIAIARGHHPRLWFEKADGTVSIGSMYMLDPLAYPPDGVVLLDVIEHIEQDEEHSLMTSIVRNMGLDGVCVIGTPNAAFDHLASPQSKAGHINTYTHARLHALMSRYFRVVQSFGLQDVSPHLGHPEARHYLLMAGIGVRR